MWKREIVTAWGPALDHRSDDGLIESSFSVNRGLEFVNKKHVLVTGGAGFIGSELVRQLAAQRFRVTVVDNLVTGKRENLEQEVVRNWEPRSVPSHA
jgi:FlaA1/EpsC-like NDP-sugar epimerase